MSTTLPPDVRRRVLRERHRRIARRIIRRIPTDALVVAVLVLAFLGAVAGAAYDYLARGVLIGGWIILLVPSLVGILLVLEERDRRRHR